MIMRICKKIVCMTLIGAMLISTLTGCGGSTSGNAGKDAKEIEIRVWQAGMGIEWLEKLIEGFEKEYPEYTVKYTASADAAGVIAPFGQESADTADLYFALGGEDYSEPLDDLLDSKAKGESKTLREKFDSSFLNVLESPSDGKIRQLTFGGGVVGIVYNKKLFDDAGIKDLPNTTNELTLVCDTLARNKITPWCHFKQSGYWHMMSEVFVMQYEGYDYYTNTLYALKDEAGNSPSLEVMTRKDGRYEVLKMYEQILTPDYVLSGSNSSDHITMQTRFIHDGAAMMINGSWLSNEMESVSATDNFGLMKTPVMSSIVKKLTTVKKDSELSAVVEAIDAVTDGEKPIEDYQKGDKYVIDSLEVSAADWEYIEAARNTVGMNYGGHSVYIPTYSDQKEGAKEFLRYMYSDVGYQTYLDVTHVSLPLSMDHAEMDINEWNDFEKANFEMLDEAYQFATSYTLKKHDIYRLGGAENLFGSQEYIPYLVALNSGDKKSADELWQDIVSHIEKNFESTWLENIK